MKKKGKVRIALDAIDKVLSVGDQEAQDLWAVLTALRGPDGTNYTAKAHTTVAIRRAAFPKTTQRHADYNDGIFIADYGHAYSTYNRAAVVDNPEYAASSYFYTHADSAARVLGLVKDNDWHR